MNGQEDLWDGECECFDSDAAETDRSSSSASQPSSAAREELLSALRSCLPGDDWRAETLVAQRLSGGVTNRMYECRHRERPVRVLVRLFGSYGMLNRCRENALFAELATAGLGPPLLGLFDGGRVEGALPGRVLDYRQLHQAVVARSVARALARLHRFEPQCIRDEAAAATESLFIFCEKLLQEAVRCGQLAPEERLSATVQKVKASPERSDIFGPASAPENAARLRAELEELRRRLPPSKVVFCHNDLLGANIVYDAPARRARLIDFEYAAYGPRAYDIGNHFNEWMGVTEHNTWQPHDPLARYPTAAERGAFVDAYLRAYERWREGGNENGDEERLSMPASPSWSSQVQRLVHEADAYSLLSHWLWGVWALVMAAAPPTDEFDYVHFARVRLEIMRRHWRERLGIAEDGEVA
ncbi:hypothetical protein CDCA_CDCA10G3084 [Cyanidium caldarium]|uniref:Ethanolamine kinase n=1 Tax=Cyanidium caldarium TaxID=2771 RepID=A0AAV9IXS3_CYACA|nr:hypothetical protein CDCA_CDCA10G3084 [Cyanidium caldarium]